VHLYASFEFSLEFCDSIEFEVNIIAFALVYEFVETVGAHGSLSSRKDFVHFGYGRVIMWRRRSFSASKHYKQYNTIIQVRNYP
jgi:hypothetical protein